jgi:pimeloyl-ACP methyl ester carboxylesterase
MTDPTFVIELPEGSLAIHDLTVGEARDGAPVVIAVHGITANGLSWQRVADEVDRRHGPGAVRFLAPDLRGRGASRDAPGPYGLATHVEDLTSIASVFGAEPLLVGHSMGAFIAALAGATHPDRFRGLVLVDGGLALSAPPREDIDATLQAVIGPAMDRLRMRFTSEAAYVEFWQAHPAVGKALQGDGGEAVRRYILHDLVPVDEDAEQLMSSCLLDAVRADGADVLADETTHAAVRRCVDLGVPVEFIWASRGLLDEPQGLYDEERIAAFGLPEVVRVTQVEEANHYSVILERAGTLAIADAIDRQLALVAGN